MGAVHFAPTAIAQLLCLTFITYGQQQNSGSITYIGTGVNVSVEKKGDSDVVVLGGLFNIRRFDGNLCADINWQGLHSSEAMVLTVDNINSNKSFLPGVTLQFEIRDTCSNINTALEQGRQYPFTVCMH